MKLATLVVGFLALGGVVCFYTGFKEWYLPVALYTIFISTVFPFLLKGKVVNKNFSQRLWLQYLFCMTWAVVIFHLAGKPFDGRWSVIFVLGIANGFGAYCHWRATQFNLSVQSLFLFLDDIIAVSLAFWILGEISILTTGMIAGLGLLILAIAAVIAGNLSGKGNGVGKESLPPVFFLYVFSYSVIWGVASFLMKYFAVKEVPTGSFLLGWYGGSFVTASAVLFWSVSGRGVVKAARGTFIGSNVPLMCLMSLLVVMNIWVSYWAFQLAPMVVVRPVFFAAQLIMPALTGLICFNEGSNFNKLIWFGFVLSGAGAVLVILNYS